MSKYRVGDVVHLKFTVNRVETNGVLGLKTESDLSVFVIDQSLAIVNHISHIEVGDRIRHVDNLHNRGTVAAVSDGKAWVRWDAAMDTVISTTSLRRLE